MSTIRDRTLKRDVDDNDHDNGDDDDDVDNLNCLPASRCPLRALQPGKTVLSHAVEGLHGAAHFDENSRQKRTSDAELQRQHGAR
jgi:hypothetical protein